MSDTILSQKAAGVPHIVTLRRWLTALCSMIVCVSHSPVAVAQTSQSTQSCPSAGSDLLCLLSTATYYPQLGPNTGQPYSDGDTACAAAAPNYGTQYRNAKFWGYDPQWGTGCEYDFYSWNGATGGYTTYAGQGFLQNWVLANQDCPDIQDEVVDTWDTADQSVNANGRRWCGYKPYYVTTKILLAAQCGTCVADPINPANGAVIATGMDVEGLSRRKFSFLRFYSNVGAGWRHSYSRSITPLYSFVTLQPWTNSLTNSSLHGDLGIACSSGFNEIKSQLNLSASVLALSLTASYRSGACVISSGSTTVAILQIHSTSTVGIIPGPSVVGFDATRDDGQLIRFLNNGTSIAAPSSINLQLQQTSSGYKLSDAGDNVEQYDANGKLLSVTSRTGMVQTMSYDSTGKLSGVSDSFGHQLTLGYDAQNRLISVTRQ